MTGRKIASVLLLPFVALACAEQGQQGERGQTGEEEMPGAEQQTTAGADTAGQAGDEVNLDEVNESGISGTAEWTAEGDSVRFVLQLDGLEQGQEYPAHVHQGDCESGGGVAVGLNPVSATQGGSGESTAVVARSSFSAGQNYFVQAHLPDGTPAACGDAPSDAGLAPEGGQGQM